MAHSGVYTRETPVPRVFKCKRCGTDVTVFERSDHRTVFCCQYCEREYYRHRERYLKRGGRKAGLTA